MFKPVIINAKTINDAWHQLVFQVEEKGRKYKITQGSFAGQFRYEFEFVLVEIERPWEEMAIIFPPGITLPPPSDMPSIEEYFANYIFSPSMAKDEQYTYGQRIAGFVLPIKNMSDVEYQNLIKTQSFQELDKRIEQAKGEVVNQIEKVIHKYKYEGPSGGPNYGNNQCTIEIGMPSDILLQDPPCLRMIDTRIEQDILHFFVYFRSWDLWGGFPVNLGGIELLKQYMAKEIGVGNGKIIAASKGLHIYDHCLAYVRMRKGETK